MANLSVSSFAVASLIAENIIFDKISTLASALDLYNDYIWWKRQNFNATPLETILFLMTSWNLSITGGARISQLISILKGLGCGNAAEKLQKLLNEQSGGIVPNLSTATTPTTSKIPRKNEICAVPNIEPQGEMNLGHRHVGDEWDAPSSSTEKGSTTLPFQQEEAMRKDPPRGKLFALIVNVVHQRPGTKVDEDRLSETLRLCNFDVTIVPIENRTEEKLLAEVTKFRNDIAEFSKKSSVGGIFVALMSHGHENVKFQTECGGSISIEKIIGEFNFVKLNGLRLRNVPKIFLINMCRGREYILHEDSLNTEETEEPFDFDWENYWNGVFENSESENDGTLPNVYVSTDEVGDGKLTWKNIYLGFSSTEGKVSYRVDYIGAWFVTDFCTVLQNKIDTRNPTPIAEIFEETKVKVGKRVGRLKEDPVYIRRRQIPTHRPVGFNNHLKFQLPQL